MTIDSVLTTEIVFRWDEARQKVLVLDGTRRGKTIAEVDLQTLGRMDWPDGSKFLGEFVTLLFPVLRSQYSIDDADTPKENLEGEG
jgi:hypothetical protein